MAKQPSANPTYKLTYFNIQLLGEPIRMILSYGGIKFEDVRIGQDEWLALKPSKQSMHFLWMKFLIFISICILETPMGQLPILEIDGIQVYQSFPILRYLAKLVGLSGTNEWEDLLIDIVADNVKELRSSKLMRWKYFDF